MTPRVGVLRRGGSERASRSVARGRKREDVGSGAWPAQRAAHRRKIRRPPGRAGEEAQEAQTPRACARDTKPGKARQGWRATKRNKSARWPRG